MTNSNLKSIYYANKRYIFYVFATIITLIIPFITINDKHIMLLSFEYMQWHLFFTSFDMQELYLMPFVIIIMFVAIFFMTTLGGRVWCGWSCPQTIFRVIYRDLIQTKLLKIRKNIKNKQKQPSKEYVKRFIGGLIWVVLSFIIASNFLWFFVPPEDFFVYLQNPSENLLLFGILACIAAFLIYDVIFLKENFCIYVCPYARIQSVMFDDDTIQTIYDTNRGGVVYDEHGKKMWKKPPGEQDECTGCEACVRVCPTHIDIRKGMQLECINCLECADACTKVMNALSKPSLISWSSPNEVNTGNKTKYFRFKTIAYLVVIAIVGVLLAFMSGKKEYMLLNINRTTQLYEIKDHGVVENAYLFLFQNTDSKDHEYYFDVDNKDIQIVRPKEAFKLKANQKIRKIVVLRTNKKLAQNDRSNVPVDIKITAYATDAKDKIIIYRDSIFVYPKQEIIKKHK